MSVSIRTFQPGDEPTQAAIYNVAAAGLPGFKVATSEEVRRRTRDQDFEASLRFLASRNDEVVGYANVWPNGRVGYPWCLPGHEDCAAPLLAAVLAETASRGMNRIFAAYRADWTAQAAFFEENGFHKAREMVNYAQSLVDLPTLVIRRGLNVSPLTHADIPIISTFSPQVLKATGDALGRHLLENSWFPPDSVFVLRKVDGTPQGVGILISNPEYASPTKIDSAAPCFRLGAFGTEGMTTKRVNGLFSFLVRNDADATAIVLDLLSYALNRIQDDTIEMLAAQVPGDAKHLHGFYQKYFRKQGSFPVYERDLAAAGN